MRLRERDSNVPRLYGKQRIKIWTNIPESGWKHDPAAPKKCEMNFRNNLTAFSWKLRNRGGEDILIAVVDGLKGFPEAITTVFPLARVQTCIVPLSRYCLSFCGWKERQAVARELQAIYRAETAEVAAKRLSEFDAGPWGKKYPMIAESWRRNWEQITPFYSYPPEVRKIIYTTNAIESLHMQLRKVLKNRGHFPSDESATKLIYLALRNITKRWTNPPLTWRMAANQFAIQFGQRFNK